MMRFWAGHAELSRQLQEVSDAILARADSEDAEVSGGIRQLLAASGKMLRPAFVLLASQFGAPDHARMVRVAAAVEMLHMATLIHDDIIDAAPLRRGVPTLHSRRGPRTAVLLGDWLFASCFSLVADLSSNQDGRALSRVVARMCGSEISQSSQRFTVDASVRRYLRRIAGKTAALFALSFHVGAVQGCCPAELVSRLRRLGYCIGMGFQIIDDILDFSPDARETGKPSGSDLSQGIYTLPVVLALRSGNGPLAKALEQSRRSRRAVARAARLVREGAGIVGARTAAGAYTRRALAAIDMLPPLPARDVLREVTDRLLHRTY
jgi:heptaprenyl diphosphate synthase